MSNIALENLENLRLPQLRDLFAEVTGEATKSPNKTYIIRRIREAIAAQAEEVIEEEQAIERQNAAPAQDADTDDDEPTLEPDASDDELPAASDETANASNHEPPADDDEPPTEDAPDAGSDKRLSKMTVEELQQRYIEVVGRPTGSSDRRYLIWKIREAKKGRIPVGPRTRRNPSEPTRNHMILPVRIESGLVERMDDARERIGLKNRMELFRRALHSFFQAHGEHELAADILPNE